jgi:hypothetical protein
MCCTFCILIYLNYHSIFVSDALWSVYLCDRGKTCTCRICSEPMRHLLGNDVFHINLCCSWIVQYILDSLRMTTIACYLVYVLYVFHSWFWQRNPVVLWHTDIRRVIGEQWDYATKIMNGRCTNGRCTRQTPDNTRWSLFLGGFSTYPS